MIRPAVLLAVIAVCAAAPVLRTTPVFSSSYFFEGVFSIPDYGIAEELTVHTDETSDMQRISYYGGRDVYLTRGDKQMVYEVVPKFDEFVCFSSNVSGPMQNGLAAASAVPLAPFLPDLSTWEFKGEEVIRNVECEVWQHEVKNFTKTAVYRFAVAKSDGSPMQLHMDGLNYVQGSHPDTYILDFHVFVPHVNASDFDIPALCSAHHDADAAPTQERVAARVRAVVDRLGRVAPPKGCGESDEFKGFMAEHGKTYANCAEAAKRESAYKANLAIIAAHNAQNAAIGASHRLAPNRFADLTDEEFKATMLQRKGRAHDNRATRTHKANENDVLPREIDWRKRGAVTPVKDQGVCGSCYAFGSVASLEGVHFNKHHRLVRVSEQQIVDCSWGYTWAGPGGNLACDGGYASAVYQWMMDNGGVASESDYPYSMQDGWCSAKDHTSGISVTGYANVSSIADLKHAVATVGPVAIAIDASHPSLRFYASGVYYEPLCKSDIDDLDHEVAAVGYGVEDGQEYWIVKNSWSAKGWGDEGYIKMSMKDNNCGVATQANYPIVA